MVKSKFRLREHAVSFRTTVKLRETFGILPLPITQVIPFIHLILCIIIPGTSFCGNFRQNFIFTNSIGTATVLFVVRNQPARHGFGRRVIILILEFQTCFQAPFCSLDQIIQPQLISKKFQIQRGQFRQLTTADVVFLAVVILKTVIQRNLS